MVKVRQRARRNRCHAGRARSIILAALLLCLILPCPAFAYEYYEDYTEIIGRTHSTYSIDLWHYSGGYWMGSDSNGRSIKITDRQVDAGGIYGAIGPGSYAKWTAAIPGQVAAEMRAGTRVTASVEGRADLYRDCFCELSGTSAVMIYAKPIFNIVQGLTLNSFVPGISVTIPLVHNTYGRNLYAMYGHFKTNLTAVGSFSQYAPWQVLGNAMHPSMIALSTGQLKDGYTVLIGGRQVASDGWSVGFFTLPRGGAVGLHFDFPVTLVFTAARTRKVWVDDDYFDRNVADAERPGGGGHGGSGTGWQGGGGNGGSGWQGGDGNGSPGYGDYGSPWSEDYGSSDQYSGFDPRSLRIHRIY